MRTISDPARAARRMGFLRGMGGEAMEFSSFRDRSDLVEPPIFRPDDWALGD